MARSIRAKSAQTKKPSHWRYQCVLICAPRQSNWKMTQLTGRYRSEVKMVQIHSGAHINTVNAKADWQASSTIEPLS